MFHVDINDLEKIYLTERFHHHWRCKPSPEHNGNMTGLATITNNHISFECKCGHTSLIPVTAFIDKFGREAKPNVVVQKARCSRCRIKTMLKVGLCLLGVWSGNAWNRHKAIRPAIYLRERKNHFRCSDAPSRELLRTQWRPGRIEDTISGSSSSNGSGILKSKFYFA